MKNITNSKWIKYPAVADMCEVIYAKSFECEKKVSSAMLEVTALGVYVAKINGTRVGDFILAPGWTSYKKRTQVQCYDITDMLGDCNAVAIGVAPGWKALSAWHHEHYAFNYLGSSETALIASIEVTYEDGSVDVINTDSSWICFRGSCISSHIYHGYEIDPCYVDGDSFSAVEIPIGTKMLIDQEGETIREQETLPALEVITTPKGETVIDFGQNMTGYVEFTVKGNPGETAVIEHAEVLDAEGNFYRENLRAAQSKVTFHCDGNVHVVKPDYNFFGFRYIRLTGFSDEIKKENFNAIVVHSDLRRTGYFECSDERLNKLFSNIIWGQKGNFLDVPTDCPQRDERLGWTGDAEVFVKTASYNYDVNRFFEKWLGDLRADQTGWGSIPHVIPDIFGPDDECSAAWADACTVCPWQMYLTYGNKDLVEKSLGSMKDYLEYIDNHRREGIWSRVHSFGDWLNLDCTDKGCSDGTDKELISTAYFIYSSEIYIKALSLFEGKEEEIERVKTARQESIEAFRNRYMKWGRIKSEYATQTACTLACHFNITDNYFETSRQLNDLVRECGHLKTGFVGTPYLLHALSDNGHVKTAYDLLLREDYPSWLFSVKMGATTIWEHWDSLKEDGSMWSTSMNSFNHYAYGSVADWMYGDAAGIKIDESKPGFEHIIFAPLTDERLTYVKASIEAKNGTVASEWHTENGKTTYIFTVPAGSTATVILDGKKTEIGEGTTEF